MESTVDWQGEYRLIMSKLINLNSQLEENAQSKLINLNCQLEENAQNLKILNETMAANLENLNSLRSALTSLESSVIIVLEKSKIELETSTNNSKRMKMNKQEIVFSVWFLSKLLDYLDFIEIARLDTAICNTSYRVNWLEYIGKHVGSKSTKYQQQILACDESIEWCSKRKVQFKCVKINNISLNITTKGGGGDTTLHVLHRHG